MAKLFCSLFLMLLAGLPSSLRAQEIAVRGYFQTDSAAIGEVIPYVLTATYPRNVQVLFPDSTFTVAPFEVVGKRFFPTRTAGERSRDSAIYYLATFELDSVQTLRLPVFVLQAKDCLAVYPVGDDIQLRFRVTMPLDSIPADKLPLKANTTYQRVRQLLNYPLLLVGLGVLVAAAVLIWIFFGKQIKRYLLLRRMKRKYLGFVQRFGEALGRMGAEVPSRMAEETLWLWKKYMEELETFPFTKSTSREIVRRYSDDGLARALRTIDRGIYGGYGASPEPFRFLQDYSRQQFERKEAEVKHG